MKSKNNLKEMYVFFYGSTFVGMTVTLYIIAMLFLYFMSYYLIEAFCNHLPAVAYKAVNIVVEGSIILFFLYRIIKTITGRRSRLEENLKSMANGADLKQVAFDFENAEQLFMDTLRIGDKYIFTKEAQKIILIEELEAISRHKEICTFMSDKGKIRFDYELEGRYKGKDIVLCQMCSLEGADREPAEAWLNVLRHLKKKAPNMVIDKSYRVTQRVIDDIPDDASPI